MKNFHKILSKGTNRNHNPGFLCIEYVFNKEIEMTAPFLPRT